MRNQAHIVASRGASPLTHMPLVIRDADDIRTLMAHPHAVRRLPPAGVKVAIESLDTEVRERFRVRLVEYIRACGCAAGGATALILLAITLSHVGLRIAARGWRGSDASVLALGVMTALVGAGFAKLTALRIARRRFETCCEETIALLRNR
jgi:hypothetical protein